MFIPAILKYYGESSYLISWKPAVIAAIKNITLNYAMWQVFKPSVIPAIKNITPNYATWQVFKPSVIPAKNNTQIYATWDFFKPAGQKKILDFLLFRPFVRHRATSGVIKNTSASSISDRKWLKKAKNQMCWKLDVLFSSGVSPYKFKRWAFASPPSAAPHYESELFSGQG